MGSLAVDSGRDLLTLTDLVTLLVDLAWAVSSDLGFRFALSAVVAVVGALAVKLIDDE